MGHCHDAKFTGEIKDLVFLDEFANTNVRKLEGKK
jgi:hypothetical protein